MGRTKANEKTGTNTRSRTISRCSSGGSGDELSGPFKSYDFKQSPDIRRVAHGCAWTAKSGAKKPENSAYGAWGSTFKSEANFKQMHWC